ncbi:MAG: prepilin peptidase [Butyrivibrio sp.]|nr:prepilin peptidase [Butyrivibrio sp.]
MIFVLGIILVLAITSIEDIRKKEIPAVTVILAAIISAASVGYQIYLGQSAYLDLALSLTPGIALLLTALITKGALGGGDGLIALAMGPALGFRLMATGMMAALLLSAVLSIILLAFKRAERMTRLPFVPFMTLGMGVAVFAAV